MIIPWCAVHFRSKLPSVEVEEFPMTPEISMKAVDVSSSVIDSGPRVRHRFPEAWLWDSIYSGYDYYS